MQERSQDSRTGAAESMSQGNSPAEGIDVCGGRIEVEDLCM